MSTLKIDNVAVKVNKEPGTKVTEVFITKTENPIIHFAAIHLDDGADLESGMYDLVLTKRANSKLPEPPAPSGSENVVGAAPDANKPVVK